MQTNFSSKEDVTKFASDNSIRILNLCHVPEDGRLRSLAFSATDRCRIDDILELGERVDGSSLFSFIEPGKSDIYIVPDIKTAFMNPFSVLPTLNVLCNYLDENGKPLDVAPQTVLARAEQKLEKSTSVKLKALAELEFYIISKTEGGLQFQGLPDKNYHDSAPFSRFEDVRNEILATLSAIGIATKYGHSEVGRVFDGNGMAMEQHEIELAAQDLSMMAEAVAVSKYVIRNVCLRHGLSVTFMPKVDLNHAGNGMHVHLCAFRDRKNIVAGESRALSEDALSMIGGILNFAPSLSAFGNPTPVSYFRFLARKESPIYVCWSERNRLALIRVPLWWEFRKHREKDSLRETFEYRAPDAFANPYLLLAGLTLAAEHGLKNTRESLKIAEDLHAKLAEAEEERFKVLPRSCSEAADSLEESMRLYVPSVFPRRLLERTVENLRNYKDKNLWKTLSRNSEQMEKLLEQYLHYG